MRENPGNTRLLVWHDTGCGKTLTALAAGQAYLQAQAYAGAGGAAGAAESRPVFVFTPHSLQSNFQTQLDQYRVPLAEAYHIFSYSTLLSIYQRDPDQTARLTAALTGALVILDEAHHLRTTASLTFQAVLAFVRVTGSRLLLTATPIFNSIQDGAALIALLDAGPPGPVAALMPAEDLTPETFLDQLDFRVSYAEGAVVNPAAFPTVSVTDVMINMSLPFYRSFRQDLVDKFGVDYRRFLHGQRALANAPSTGVQDLKLDALTPLLLDVLPTVVYSNFLENGIFQIATFLDGWRQPYRIITGDTSVADRQAAVDAFNAGAVPRLLLSPAGGEGLDLKGVRRVIIMDPPWHAAGMRQIIGRASRFHSHAHLPVAERQVQVYRAILLDPEMVTIDDHAPGNSEPLSGDVLLYRLIQEKERVDDDIRRAVVPWALPALSQEDCDVETSILRASAGSVVAFHDRSPAGSYDRAFRKRRRGR